jgi:hypothetical protein
VPEKIAVLKYGKNNDVACNACYQPAVADLCMKMLLDKKPEDIINEDRPY